MGAISSAYGELTQSITGTIDLATTTTVVPGVYDVSAGNAFTHTLTLDGSGVYIFRSTSGIYQTAGGTMLLTNGACASDVFWQVATDMTFAAAGNIEGTIIANTVISFVSGVNLKGRAWAGTQVTMDNNQITQPVCAAASSSTSSTSNSTSTSTSTTSSPVAAYCPPISNQVVTPIIIESKRINANSIFLKWGPYSGVDTFNVRYGPTNGNWLYNTDVTGFSTTINALPSNQPFWFQVAARNECQIGTYGESKFTGAPRLPNTGFAPQNNNFFYVLNQIKSWLLGH